MSWLEEAVQFCFALGRYVVNLMLSRECMCVLPPRLQLFVVVCVMTPHLCRRWVGSAPRPTPPVSCLSLLPQALCERGRRTKVPATNRPRPLEKGGLGTTRGGGGANQPRVKVSRSSCARLLGCPLHAILSHQCERNALNEKFPPSKKEKTRIRPPPQTKQKRTSLSLSLSRHNVISTHKKGVPSLPPSPARKKKDKKK